MAAWAAGSAAVVEQWGYFEGEIRSPKSYDDPFRAVTLETRFRRPDGTELKFWGFHVGGDVWKFRAMAEQPGTWTYTARFSDGAAVQEGTFAVRAGSNPAMVEVSARNPQWFGRRGGAPMLLRAIHVGDRFFAKNWPAAERERALDYLKGQGYNVLSVASHYLNRNTRGRGEGWETPALWPLNPAEYERMEHLLELCRERGFIVYPFAGFFGQDSAFPVKPADQELYIRYTLARLAPLSQIVLNVAGPEPNLANKVWLESRDVERLGRLIRRLDPYAHPLSVHNETGDDEYKHSDWTSFGTLQGPKTLDRLELGRGLRKNHHWAKPVFAQETLWTGNKNHPAYTREDLRKNAWVLLFSAVNFCFADNRGNSSTGFTGTLDPADADGEAHQVIRQVWDAFEQLPFGSLTPDYAVIPRGAAAWCLSDRASRYIVYLEKSGEQALKLPAGDYAARWFDPRSPAQAVKEERLTSGKVTTPEGGDDWLLELQRLNPTP